MKRIARICGRWELAFEVPAPAERAASDVPYVEQIFQRTKDVSACTAAGFQMIEDLPRGVQVAEFYGGAGLQSTIIEKLLEPERHIIIERDEGCIEHLKRTFGGQPHIKIFQADCLALFDKIPADVYLIDSNSFTFAHWPEWKPRFDALVARAPTAIIWFDTARPYFHFNKDKYAAVLGQPLGGFEGYSEGVRTLMNQTYGPDGYEVDRIIHCPRAAYYRMVHRDLPPGPPTTSVITYSDNNGFEWIGE